jgi:hypothetical protein
MGSGRFGYGHSEWRARGGTGGEKLSWAHGVLPFSAICSSKRASLSASSNVSIALAVFPTRLLNALASLGVMSPPATASVSAAAAAIRSEAALILGSSSWTGRSLRWGA